MLYESHCHTPLCKHATGSPGDYAAAAQRRGLKGVIVTCHCPLPDGLAAEVRMAPGEFPRYVDLVAEAAEVWAGKVDVRLGLESDYYPGVEWWLEELHGRAPLHHVLGSVHYHMGFYRDRFHRGDALAYQRIYYEHLAQSAETGLYDTLAHPDLIKNDAPAEWEFARIRREVEHALDRIAKTGVAMELNTSGLLKTVQEMNPGPLQLSLMCERGIPVVLGADAHHPERVGDRFVEALELLDAAGYSEVSYFLDRRRQTVPIHEALASLAAPETA